MAAAAAGITFLASCVDDNYTEFDKGSDTLLLKAGTEEVLMEEVNYSSDAISLEWSTGHNFGTGNKIFYTLEIDKAGNDFADPYVAVNAEKRVYSWTKTVEEFNEIIRGKFGNISSEKIGDKVSYSLEARITATVPECTETQVSTVTFDVTTYVPVTKTLYIIGDAAPNGWSADNAVEMSRTSNGVFTWTGNMKEGDFKFITTLGQFLPSYNKGADGKLVYRGSDDDPDEKFRIDEGYTYKIDVNLLTGEINWNKSDADAQGLRSAVAALAVVEIEVAVRSHNHIEALCGGLFCPGSTPPGHHCGARRELSFQNLVPSYDLFALRSEEGLDSCGDIVLKVLLSAVAVLVRKAEGGNPGLAVGTFLPLFLRALVASYVNVFAREKLAYLRKHSFKEFEGALLPDAQNLGRNSPFGPGLIRPAAASQIRVGAECGQHMARKVYLRNHLDSKGCGILDYFPHFLLGVAAAVTHPVVRGEVLAYHGSFPVCSFLGQEGV